MRALAPDAGTGVAIHSLRAVDPKGVAFAASLAPQAPLHIHAAEQTAEVEEVEEFLGARPVEWLLANLEVDERWCLVHATHMTPGEASALAGSGAVAGLCPITEASLGDGIFEGAAWLERGGRFGVGTDSNIRSPWPGLRMLEYSSACATERRREVLARPGVLRPDGRCSRPLCAAVAGVDARRGDARTRPASTIWSPLWTPGGELKQAGRHDSRQLHIRRRRADGDGFVVGGPTCREGRPPCPARRNQPALHPHAVRTERRAVRGIVRPRDLA